MYTKFRNNTFSIHYTDHFPNSVLTNNKNSIISEATAAYSKCPFKC